VITAGIALAFVLLRPRQPQPEVVQLPARTAIEEQAA
jgi:hypothetical protein